MRDLLTSQIVGLVPDLQIYVGDPDQDQLKALVADSIAVLNGHTIMDRDLLSACRKLKSIVYLGTGASTFIDIPATEEFGIRVRTVQNYGDRAVAEHAFALTLAAARDIARMDRELRAGTWNTRAGLELKDKVLGVVGTGGIGAELIRIANHFGMSVIAWNRSGARGDLRCRMVQIDELMRESDVVSLHLTLNDDTRAFIDARRLSLMKSSAILVNTSRGAIIDEGALVEALREGRIGHAALDVFETEPLPSHHPLAQLENVTLTAHAGFKTAEAGRRLLARGYELLRHDIDVLALGKELSTQAQC
jgi:D-3-phosphoglycerate dehydrogenase